MLGTHGGWAFWILLPAAGLMAALWGVILGFPVLRLRGDYLAIVTLAFGEIIRLVLINWREVTNGTAGISGIPKVSFFGWFSFDVSSPDYISKVFGIAQSGAYYKIFLYYLILALAMLTAFVTIRLRRMPVGRAWEALREDEIACRSLGINTTTTKLTAFATGAMFGGFAGSFFAARQGFVSPESFVFLESGDHPGHRGAGRHGLAHRHRHCSDGDDRRHRDPARTAVPESRVRPGLHARTLPHAAVRSGHGYRHAVEAARFCRKSGTDGLPP